ncbi:MAG: peptidase S41, partial [Arachnia sp.]
MTPGYLRYPNVHGNQVTFVADDDLWLTALDGGRAHRLTIDSNPPRSPRFSPDGKRIAYAGNVGGGFDLHVVDLAGGRRRLTWLAANRLLVCGWLDDGHVLVVSDHSVPHRGLAWLYSVSLDGDLARIPWGPAGAADTHRNGKVVVASPNFRGPEMWKRYRGGEASRLWVSDSERATWTRILPDVTASLTGPAWFGDRIIFTSDLGAELPGKPGEQAQLWSV